ncbi:MAG TPA: enolase C-terminal domain-like protein [Chloroflexota bacterium]|nr:enolase C-terminal domain-like protein [Chloroflexota bacterium]
MPRITALYAAHPEGPGGPRDWRMTLGQILVAVETDDGVRGIGVGGGGPVGVYLVHTILCPLLLGQELDSIKDIERLWERMYRDTLAYGRKGLAIMAISGVDLALWDALGHSQGKSVATLLGGPRQSKLPCYATTRDPAAAVQQGFTAVKLGLAGGGPDEAIKLIAETRRRIGPGIKLMTDAWGQWSFDESLRAAQRLAEYDLTWLEEPLPPDDHEGYARLSELSPVPIAGGEHEYTVRGFRELAKLKAHPIWQPDVCWTGGLTQLKAIYALAAEEGTRVIPHRGGEVWSLHAIAALDSEPLAESGRPWMTWIEGQPPIQDGHIEVPDLPGFGVTVREDVEALLQKARSAHG